MVLGKVQIYPLLVSGVNRFAFSFAVFTLARTLLSLFQTGRI